MAEDVKSNPKAFYQYVASKTKSKESVPNLHKADGSLTEDDLEKAEVLNNFLVVYLQWRMKVIFLILSKKRMS